MFSIHYYKCLLCFTRNLNNSHSKNLYSINTHNIVAYLPQHLHSNIDPNTPMLISSNLPKSTLQYPVSTRKSDVPKVSLLVLEFAKVQKDFFFE